MTKEDKTIPFLNVLLVIQKDRSLGHKVSRKPTHTAGHFLRDWLERPQPPVKHISNAN